MRQLLPSSRKARISNRVGGGRRSAEEQMADGRFQAVPHSYSEVTRRLARRAPERFQQCDWDGAQMDLVERLELRRIAQRDSGGDTAMLTADSLQGAISTRSYSMRRVECTHSLADGVQQVLDQLPLEGSWEDLPRCTRHVVSVIRTELAAVPESAPVRQIAWLPVVLYRFKRACIVGLLMCKGRSIPLGVSVTNGEQGMAVHDVLVGESAVATLFTAGDAEYFTDPAPCAEMVGTVRELMPQLPLERLCQAMF